MASSAFKRRNVLRHEFAETFPDKLVPGVLYVSLPYSTCAHLCACGCGEEVVTPLSPAQWSLTYNGADITLRPSVGNWSLPCRSHYVIDHGNVRWAQRFPSAAVAQNRAADMRALQRSDPCTRESTSGPDVAVSPVTSNEPGRLERFVRRALQRVR